MSSHYWIKLYEEILDDSKMATMPDRLWRRTIEIFLLAGRYNKKGILPPTNELAWVLRLPIEELEFDMRQIEMVGIIERLPDGGWIVNKFAQRQAKMTDAERSQLHRDKQHYNQYYNQEVVTLSDAYVTQITDTYTDTYVEPQKELHKEIQSIAIGNNVVDIEEPKSPAKKNGDDMNKEEYLRSIEQSVMRGMIGDKNDYAKFPPDTVLWVARFCELWNYKPPQISKDRAYWITSCRSLKDACGEFGLELLDEFHMIWEEAKNSHGGTVPFSFSDPNGLVKTIRGFAASKRRGDKYAFNYPREYKVEHQSRLDV